ncbi:hypothetical protein GCM10020220_092770 [Nonomuraea rubra]|uniref:LacI family DNA-binding transcriptional regulator n=1 Tax=Nonomuraea rubra TaxID=46180 RepID=UPI00337005D8
MRGRTFTIGVLLPHIRNPFFADLIDGLTEEISASGYQAIMVQSGGRDPADELRASDALVDRQVDGVLWVAPVCTRTQLEKLAKGTPLVVLGRHDRSGLYDCVLDDDEVGAELVVEHLIGLGHRRIAHITQKDSLGGRTGTLLHTIRATTYERVMTEHGLAGHIAVAATSYTEEWGLRGHPRAAGPRAAPHRRLRRRRPGRLRRPRRHPRGRPDRARRHLGGRLRQRPHDRPRARRAHQHRPGRRPHGQDRRPAAAGTHRRPYRRGAVLRHADPRGPPLHRASAGTLAVLGEGCISC